MSSNAVDVAIVGGGVIGSAIAYFLAAEPQFTGTVRVFERDWSYEEASTARSVGSVRQQFSVEENILISKYCIEFLKDLDEYLSVDGDAPDVGFVDAAYLFLAGPRGRQVLEANHAVQRRCGAQVALLSPAQLSARFPWMRVDDVVAGSLGLANEGWLDPFALMQAFRRKARSLGVVYVEDEVTGLQRDGHTITGVILAAGGLVPCATVVNAAGPRADKVAAMAGIDLPVRPRKRLVYFFRCATAIDACPLVIGPTGLYFRPEGNGFLCGLSPPDDADPDSLDLEVDYDYFDDPIWPLLADRVPAFEEIKLVRAWAGHYAYNTRDQNAVLGPHPEIENFIFANGFSGHGLQQSPAVGRGISEIVTFGDYRSLDLRRLSFERLISGRLLHERAIV